MGPNEGKHSMTGIITSGEKRLVVVSGRAHPQLALDVTRELGTEVLSSSAYDFANGETYVRFNESVRGCDVFVVQSHGDRVNDWLMEQLIMVDALKRASAKRISVVAPSSPTPVRTRSTWDASPSAPASWRTFTRPPAPTAS